MKKTFTISEAAEMLKISEEKVQKLIDDGILNAFRIGKSLKLTATELSNYLGDVLPDMEAQAEIAPEAAPEPEEAAGQTSEDPYIICGQDPVLDLVWEHLTGRKYDRPLGRSYICSYQSLNALYFDEVKAGAAHLIDIRNNNYNRAYIQYLIPGNDCVLIHLTKRSQGFFVKAGNPKNIKGWADLARPDVKFMNREPGAGVRILIDERLREQGITHDMVRGYNDVAQSHIAAASAVGRGDCDVSLGAKRVTPQVKGIEFIEMQRERYELVIKRSSYNDPQIQDIIALLRTDEIRNKIAEIEGYYPDEMGKVTFINQDGTYTEE